MRRFIIILITICIAVPAFSQKDVPDAAMVQKIREEGLNNSQVMDIVFYLTEVSGSRLNNSPGYKRAANWAKNKLSEWGLDNSKLEPWGDWGKGWDLEKSYVAMTAPWYKPIIAFPKTWTSGTNGPKNAEIIIVSAKDSAGLATYKGKLKGKVILLPRTDTLIPSYTADASRRNDEALQRMAEFTPSAPAGGGQRRGGQGGGRGPNQQLVSIAQLRDMAKAEGAVAILSTSPRGRDGTLFVQGGGAYQPGSPENFLDVMVAYEDYMMLQRLAQHNIPVKLEVDVKTKFFNEDMKGYTSWLK